jgi:hypothetical protein
MWAMFGRVEWDPWHHAWFLMDTQYDYGLASTVKEEEELPVERDQHR